MSLWLGLALAAVVSGTAWRFRALTVAGAVAATGIGAIVLFATGWSGGTVLIGYFLLGTAVGRATGLPGDGVEAKGETRDHWQVLANGGPATLGSLAELITPGLGFWLLAISLSASAADTVATGIGRLSVRAPRDILRWRPVPAGTSGGVTLFGSSAGIAAAALISLLAAVARPELSRGLYPAATVIGVLGMAIDSVLGAGLQSRFRCRRCGRATERRRHCGLAAEHQKGWRWLDNDGVNALSTAAAALLGWLWWLWR